jgi:hypothetical protein
VSKAHAAQPGGAVPMRDPNKRRMRIHQKVGALGHYQAGLSHHGGKAFVATRHGVSHRR